MEDARKCALQPQSTSAQALVPKAGPSRRRDGGRGHAG